MSTIISNIQIIFTAAIGWVTEVSDCIVENPLLLVFALIPLVGLGIGLFKRLISVN